jgi:hypothetical protein
MNVAVARGSRAERHFRGLAAPLETMIEPEVRAPGLPATPKHNLRFHGGKTIANLAFANRYVGGAAAWKTADIQRIDHALSKAMADAHLNNVLRQYFKGAPITSTFKGSTTLPGTPPARFTQGDVEKLVSQLFAGGALGGFDLASTVFNFLLPSGSVLTTDTAPTTAAHSPVSGVTAAKHPVPVEDEADSLNGLGGYHGSVHVNASTRVYYAIGVYSELLPGGRENGIVAFDAPWKNVVATFYHELCEARTDADVEDAIRAGNTPQAIKFLGWVSSQGEECGDFPIFESSNNLALVMQEVALADGTGTVPVQFQYSNAVKGPEGPIAKPH